MDWSAQDAPSVLARNLMRDLVKGGLATLDHASGAPYVSMVNVAADEDGSPILLLSDLARHTANLAADKRASLLFDQTDRVGDPTTGARLTLMGRMGRTTEPEARQRYLARIPSALQYADFGDFAFWRMEIASGHFIAGFGRIQTLTRADLCTNSGP